MTQANLQQDVTAAAVALLAAHDAYWRENQWPDDYAGAVGGYVEALRAAVAVATAPAVVRRRRHGGEGLHMTGGDRCAWDYGNGLYVDSLDAPAWLPGGSCRVFCDGADAFVLQSMVGRP